MTIIQVSVAMHDESDHSHTVSKLLVYVATNFVVMIPEMLQRRKDGEKKLEVAKITCCTNELLTHSDQPKIFRTQAILETEVSSKRNRDAIDSPCWTQGLFFPSSSLFSVQYSSRTRECPSQRPVSPFGSRAP